MAAEKYKCGFCRHEYIRKNAYDKHVLLCQLQRKTVKERQRDQEDWTATPSVRELYLLICELNAKNTALEKKVDELTKWAAVKKRQLPIIDWLNENYIQGEPFHTWLANITLRRPHLVLLFENGFIEGYIQILRQLLPFEENLPIKAFDQKDNMFYIRGHPARGHPVNPDSRGHPVNPDLEGPASELTDCCAGGCVDPRISPATPVTARSGLTACCAGGCVDPRISPATPVTAQSGLTACCAGGCVDPRISPATPVTAQSGLTGCPRGVCPRGGWSIMTPEIWQSIMGTLNKQLRTEFRIWQAENMDKMHQDNFSIIYAENVKKIFGGNTQTFDRIKRDLYKHLKVNIQARLQQYAVEF